MSNSLVITNSAKYNKSFLLQYEDNKPIEIQCISRDNDSILNNIYIGRVKNIVKNINAAFIEIADNIICYFDMNKKDDITYIKSQSPKKLCEGDEILVQVTRDPHKTKQASLSANICFTGQYLVLSTGNKGINVSSKLDPDTKQRLHDLAQSFDISGFGLVFRTNAKSASDELIKNELNTLSEELKKVISDSMHKNGPQLIAKGTPDYIQTILGLYEDLHTDRIVTDDSKIYDSIISYSKIFRPEFLAITSFYEDSMISLNALYGIDASIEKALNKNVWLKSGAYLVIEPTEAMTVIDVNSGKYDAKTKDETSFLKINLEAAKEISRQLRLRNIAGICMIDFIDMKSAEDKQTLLDSLSKYIQKDPIQTQVVDMTKLNLVEVTRKRIKKSLYEQIYSNE